MLKARREAQLLRSPINALAVSLNVSEKPQKNHYEGAKSEPSRVGAEYLVATWKDTVASVIMLRYIIVSAFFLLDNREWCASRVTHEILT